VYHTVHVTANIIKAEVVKRIFFTSVFMPSNTDQKASSTTTLCHTFHQQCRSITGPQYEPSKNLGWFPQYFGPLAYTTRHRANTSMYSLTFCVRVMSPKHHHWKPAVQAATVMFRTPPPVDSQLPASQPHPLPIYGAQF